MLKLKNDTTDTKAFAQQRATPKSIKQVATYEEEQEHQGVDLEFEQDSYIDDSSSCDSVSMTGHDSRNQTMLLAQFLSTTGPEEFDADSKKQPQLKKAYRLLKRLRKGAAMPVLKSAAANASNTILSHDTNATITTTTEKKMNYIPLPVYGYQNTADSSSSYQQQQQKNQVNYTTPPATTHISRVNPKPQQHNMNALRDSGIYSETNSEKGISSPPSPPPSEPLPPLPPFTTVMNDLKFPHPPYTSSHNYQRQHQTNRNRHARLPPAAIAAAASVYTSNDGGGGGGTSSSSRNRSLPEATLKRKSVRLRHVQVQTNQDDEIHTATVTKTTRSNDSQACPHCRQVITAATSLSRRPSCPPALASGRLKETEQDALDLLEMIMRLKSQLEEEKRCRLKLEKEIYQGQLVKRREEKERWDSACLWLNNHIALLPE